MSNEERIQTVITAFEDRIEELQTEGYESPEEFQQDSLLNDLASYLVQNCSISKRCLEILMQIIELYPTIMKNNTDLLDKVIQITKQEDLELNPYLLQIWEKVESIENVQKIIERINELHPFANNSELVQSFETKSDWTVQRVKESIQTFAKWIDEELVPLAQTENYYAELTDLLSPFINEPSRKLANESFPDQIEWFRKLTQHKYQDSPTGSYKEICYLLARLDIDLSTQYEWIPHPNKEFHTMFLITSFLEN
ncbi:MAG: hypothetical protein GF308_21970 [Candidatus Heimdallarchaeota archaeon]|nr:hypothetical protein [Candidatus Heimdallarchaeota archaeon]